MSMLMSAYIVPSAFRPYGIVQAAERQLQCQCLLTWFRLHLGNTEWFKLRTDGVIVKMSVSAYMVPCAFRPLGRGGGWGGGSCRAAWRTY